MESIKITFPESSVRSTVEIQSTPKPLPPPPKLSGLARTGPTCSCKSNECDALQRLVKFAGMPPLPSIYLPQSKVEVFQKMLPPLVLSHVAVKKRREDLVRPNPKFLF